MFKNCLVLCIASASIISTAFASGLPQKAFPVKNLAAAKSTLSPSTSTQNNPANFIGTWSGICSLNGRDEQTEWNITQPHSDMIDIKSNVIDINDMAGSINSVSDQGFSDTETWLQTNTKFRLGSDGILHTDSAIAFTAQNPNKEGYFANLISVLTTYSITPKPNQLVISGKTRTLAATADVNNIEFNCSLAKR